MRARAKEWQGECHRSTGGFVANSIVHEGPRTAIVRARAKEWQGECHRSTGGFVPAQPSRKVPPRAPAELRQVSGRPGGYIVHARVVRSVAAGCGSPRAQPLHSASVTNLCVVFVFSHCYSSAPALQRSSVLVSARCVRREAGVECFRRVECSKVLPSACAPRGGLGRGPVRTIQYT